jgi:hypothetical protein
MQVMAPPLMAILLAGVQRYRLTIRLTGYRRVAQTYLAL